MLHEVEQLLIKHVGIHQFKLVIGWSEVRVIVNEVGIPNLFFSGHSISCLKEEEGNRQVVRKDKEMKEDSCRMTVQLCFSPLSLL
jgi:hypothetical protein